MIFDQTYEANHYLTKELAEFRAQYVTNVNYKVSFTMPRGEQYFGKTVINFDLTQPLNKPLYISFRGQAISNLEINGKLV